MLVILIRHSEAEGTGGKRFLGHSDPPLGPLGREQARHLAARLRTCLATRLVTHPDEPSLSSAASAASPETSVPDAAASPDAASGASPNPTPDAVFDAVHSSDLQRCLQTAEIIVADTGVPVIPHRWLREIDSGLWEGLTWEEAARRYPAEYADRERDVLGYRFPGGESFQDLRSRVVPRFMRLIGDELATGHGRVLVVAHKGVNRVLLAHFLGLPFEQLFSIEQGYDTAYVLRASREPSGELHILAERMA